MAPAPGPSLGSTGVMLAGKQSGSGLGGKQRGGSTTGLNLTGKRASTPDSLGGSNGYFTQVLLMEMWLRYRQVSNLFQFSQEESDSSGGRSPG